MKQIINLKTKQWGKYNLDEQELILQKYDVVLTDHETTNEKLERYGKAINFENYKKGMKKFDTVMKGVDKFWKDFDKQWSASLSGGKGSKTKVWNNGKVSSNMIWGSQKKKRELKTSKKSKPEDNVSLIYGNSKTKVRVF